MHAYMHAYIHTCGKNRKTTHSFQYTVDTKRKQNILLNYYTTPNDG